MSNSFYEETLLKEEYNLVEKLQQDSEFKKYVTVLYEDRILGEERAVSLQPTGSRFPEKYIVHYNMPVYVSRGQLRQDWKGVATIELSEPVLTNKHSHQGPHVVFHSDFEPFNNHVHKSSICSGNAWAVAKENGLWHFIISLGALINQDEFVSAEGNHFNGDAYDYWVSRGRKPVTNIKWALDLISREDNKIVFTEKNKPSTGLNIVPKTITAKANTAINITPKDKPITTEIKITERKK